MKKEKEKELLILIPMAGSGKAFVEAGYAFPKPLIDIEGKTMVELVINNVKPAVSHKFVFVVLKEQYDKYDFHNIFKNATNNSFEVVTVGNSTQGAAVTALSAIQYLDTDNEVLLANADQFLNCKIDDFIKEARKKNADGYIMTFNSSHPRWSYVRTDEKGQVIEAAEKKVISNHATVGLYYYKTGKVFVSALKSMIKKNIRHNNEFYICPAFNEIILQGGKVGIFEIPEKQMYGMGTPEELVLFQKALSEKKITLKK
ncbi:MAG: Nucleotidyl transferase [Parcubacteria group bacterium GW2011_GWD2_42_14]|nr:MAG: Nucleotidyl transferase [Parcubacteria group bacterium GW2011_GWD2_42_14]